MEVIHDAQQQDQQARIYIQKRLRRGRRRVSESIYERIVIDQAA